MDFFADKIFLYVIIVLAAVFHEYAHAWMAYRLGDHTAKDSGRLTLNPIAHLDPLGTVAIPLLFLFMGSGFIGWAKPVPYNPFFLRGRYGNLKVALAGPAANIVIALVLALFFRIAVPQVTENPHIFRFFNLLIGIVHINIILALFNLIPVPPLDGSKVIMDLFPRVWVSVAGLGIFGVLIALLVAPIIIFPFALRLTGFFLGIPLTG